MLASGHADVWTYRFDWDELPAIPFIRPDLLLGAAHAMEMAFAFGDTEGEFDIFKANTPFNRKGRVALAQAMSCAWASFARDGQPALPDARDWPRRQATGTPDSLVFDIPSDGGVRMAALRTSAEGLKQALRASPLPVEARCRIYARAFLWNPVLAGRGSLDEYGQWCASLGHGAPAEAYRPGVEI
jgi:para-nitrobenzyl esterase